jgi:hypothetical protein
MIRHGRGSTSTTRPAALPAGTYDPPELLRHGQDGLVLNFHGEDDRDMTLRFEVVPLAGWREPLAMALAQRIGPAGGLRTQASVRSQWDVMLRFVRFLHGLSDPPAIPSQLRRGHLEAFHAHRRSRIGDRYARTDIVGIRALLNQQPLRDELPSCVLDYFATRVQKVVAPPKPGYSDGEFRRLVSTARSDVAAIRARLAASETVLARFADGPGGLALRRQDADDLNRMAESGAVPTCLENGLVAWTQRRRELAERLRHQPRHDSADGAVGGGDRPQRRDAQGTSSRAHGPGRSCGPVASDQAPPGATALVRDGDLGDRSAESGTAHPRRAVSTAAPVDAS